MDDFNIAAHPNDGYFKAVFSNTARAALFFQEHLPPELVAQTDWSSLRLLPGSFVKQSLQQSHSDLLFSVSIAGCETLLYLLFEHQTTVDPAMPLRVLGYKMEIWQTHWKEHGLPLPIVIPFVLHQGPDTWHVSTQFSDLMDIPASIADAILPYIPKFQHALLDLSLSNGATSQSHAELRLVMKLMKLARTKDLAGFLQWFREEAAQLGWQVPIELVSLSFMYVLHADASIDLQQIEDSLHQLTQGKEEIMSLAQRLRIEGRAEGEVLGKILLLQQLMGEPQSTREELVQLSLSDLEARFATLEASYTERFKRP
jgi:predicted transposase/invertase (TIGR01784 family)